MISGGTSLNSRHTVGCFPFPVVGARETQVGSKPHTVAKAGTTGCARVDCCALLHKRETVNSSPLSL
jgi:hypothetical protein